MNPATLCAIVAEGDTDAEILVPVIIILPDDADAIWLILDIDMPELEMLGDPVAKPDIDVEARNDNT